MSFSIGYRTNAPVQFTDEEQELLCNILFHIKGAPLNDNVAEFFWESYEEMDSDKVFESILRKVQQAAIIKYE
jgi:hypothetical protein